MADDEELQALRAQRLAQLQAQNQGGDGASAAEKQASDKAKEQDFRNSILSQVLNQQARARLSNIAVAKPEKARMVEDLLINMARRGQLQGKLGEDDLKSLLGQVQQQTQKTTSVKFDRRRVELDDDDD